VIEEKLKKARLRIGKRRIQLVSAMLAAIFFCSLLMIGLSSYDFSEKKSVQAVVSPKKILVKGDKEKIRENFIEKLQEYETELEPRLTAANVELWNQNAFVEMHELKTRVMSSFTNGDYQIATENLMLLKNLTKEIIREADNIFEENLENAASLLTEDLYDGANFHIKKALLIHPQSTEALGLQLEIEKLPYLIPLSNDAKAARAEKDLQKEYDLLQQVLSIAPDRRGVKDRLKMMAGLIKTQNFDAHISSGFSDIEKREAKKARYHYQEARKIDSRREELAILAGQLLELEKSIRVQQAINQAEQAIRQDDWQQAKKHFARAAKDAPENKTVAEGIRRASYFLELLEDFRQYFKNPYRLAHADVRSKAEMLLVRAEKASNYSFKITRQAKELNDLILKTNRLIPVTITSDNKTYILVRRVGKVGVISQKNIQLKPGSYTFEGARNGFKSKLVQAFIPYDQNNFSVHIICDEPI